MKPDQFFAMCRVALEFPRVEVRFQDLKIEASVHVGSRALPTVPNSIFNMTEVNFMELYRVIVIFKFSILNLTRLLFEMFVKGFVGKARDIPW